MPNYYCIRGAKRFGPFSFKQIQQLGARGRLQTDDVIASEDAKIRSYARDIRKLRTVSPHGDSEWSPEPDFQSNRVRRFWTVTTGNFIGRFRVATEKPTRFA